MAKRWTDEEHARLVELASDGLSARMAAKLIGRPVAGVSSRASAHDIEFDSPPNLYSISSYLEKGGRICREDVGGSVGLRWFPAHRSSGTLDKRSCEILLKHGAIVEDSEHPGSFYHEG